MNDGTHRNLDHLPHMRDVLSLDLIKTNDLHITKTQERQELTLSAPLLPIIFLEDPFPPLFAF